MPDHDLEIPPYLTIYRYVSAYEAVGIALASAASAYTFHKNKNIDVKNVWRE